MKMEQTECSETSAYKIQTPGNYPEENIENKYVGVQVFTTVKIHIAVFLVVTLCILLGQ